MKTYIDGYYCRDDLHLQIINKDSNRKILETLRDSYPKGLSVEDLSKSTKLSIKAIYAQKAELFREYFINHLEEKDDKDLLSKKRGRTPTRLRELKHAKRKPVRIVIEEASGLFDAYERKKPTTLPPGNVIYSEGLHRQGIK